MNILVFSTVFYPSIGGIENQTLLLVKEFINQGHVVKVITKQKRYKHLPGIDVINRPNFVEGLRLYLWCDVFYMPNISLKGIWMLAFNPFKKWVISHNDFHLYLEENFISYIKRTFVRGASENIVVSNSIANIMKASTHVVYNCYDDDVFRLYPEEDRVYDFVFLGRLVSQKGCDLLIRACKDLNKPFTLNIIGDGFEKDNLTQLVDRYGLSDCISFSGFMSGEELARVLNRHKVMVIPSLGVEGFGIVALEGMACGCKIIASNAGGLVEAVSTHGDLFETGNQQQLTNLLKKALETPYQLPGPKLTNYLSQQTKKAVAERYLELFQSSSR